VRLEIGNAVRAPIDRRLLRRVVREVIHNEGLVGPLKLAVHLLDDKRIGEANRKRGVEGPTDVLSFPLSSQLQPGDQTFVAPPGEPRHLGDVLISYERAQEQAARYGHSVEREVCYLLAHGVLHLLGYDHVEEDERRRMREREEAALEPLGLRR
jgi:probable rRNA maturation factor